MTVDAKRAVIVELCRRLGVRRLDVFGSATGISFDAATSDVDFVVELADGPDDDPFDAYFSLKKGLEDVLSRPVDLMTRSSTDNPFFRQRVEQTQEYIYAA